MTVIKKILFLFITLSFTLVLYSQKDSTKPLPKKDTATIKKHNPRIATLRSALVPGWGQAYNQQYWKVPIVLGALAIPTYTFFYNNNYYKLTKFAYEAKLQAAIANATAADSINYKLIDPQLINLSPSSLQSYRNQFRRDRDYSVLWFLIIWGLNVADATVFGHLKDFNVSNDLSMRIEPGLQPTGKPGLNLVLGFRNKTHQLKAVAR